ncbi:MAG: bifunctional diaminohydroxyphosphoribosylaminopyrimidine deaminase/5-amino-6-(5-phosphoribosylamino)uracil reductase RibD [Actinobacteria bacterium]|nr:bifunctional diaminohydroxyphosphoribosylaminopyrimidine deaminase/5-amino-6-(5-phosphoribosylamino)uracil reductase RibD [Actinomycetota bacterium]
MGLNRVDMAYLDRALALAELGRGCTSPNPVVGAVIVRDSEVLGEGHHAGPGRDHAEVVAIKDALNRAGTPVDTPVATVVDASKCRPVCADATMYVTLEPCCVYGRTPPCTEALIGAGFGRVVVGALDPSPQMNGKGVDLLRAAGIEVDLAEGALALRAKRQNNGQRKAAITGLPFVIYKYAMTLDGRVATDSGDSRWISSEQSRALVHQWRAWSDAVVVGAGTLRADDPRLTARDVRCERQPLRVVVDRRLELDPSSALVRSVDDGPVLAVCGADVSEKRRDEVEQWGVETVAVAAGASGMLDPVAVAKLLGERNVQTVLLEGGPKLAGSWWNAGLVDQVGVFVCPLMAAGVDNRGALCGPGAARMDEAVRLRETEVEQVGPDVLVSGYTGEPF